MEDEEAWLFLNIRCARDIDPSIILKDIDSRPTYVQDSPRGADLGFDNE